MNLTQRAASTTITVTCLIAATACAGSDDEAAPDDESPVAATAENDASTQAPDTTPEVAATEPEPPATEPSAEPTTTEVPAVEAPTTEPAAEMLAVPFSIVDAGFPEGATCSSAISGFDVAFIDADGQRIEVEARFAGDELAEPELNANCSTGEFQGAFALLVSATLDVRPTDTFQLIEVRYPYADGEGSDRYDLAYEAIGASEAESGLFLAMTNDGATALDPATLADFVPAE